MVRVSMVKIDCYHDISHTLMTSSIFTSSSTSLELFIVYLVGGKLFSSVTFCTLQKLKQKDIYRIEF